jgi:enediyne biosynthesis protein E4
VENYWPWGVSVADINADGWDDVLITSGMSYPFRYGINSMLLNNRGEKFLDSEFLLGIEPRPETHTPLFDLDCSQADLNHMNRMVCGGRTGKITVMSTTSTRGSAIFDIDNDGDLDIVTGEWNAPPRVLMSDLAQRKKIHWFKIILLGTASNRNGLGATVRVHAGGQVYMKCDDGKSGYLAQSVLPLYFGLGDATKVDEVDVDWLSTGRAFGLVRGWVGEADAPPSAIGSHRRGNCLY